MVSPFPVLDPPPSPTPYLEGQARADAEAGRRIDESIARAFLRRGVHALSALGVVASLAGCASQSAEVTTAEGDTMRVSSWTIAKDLQDPGGEFEAGPVRLALGAGASTSMTPEQAMAYMELLGILARGAP